MRASRCAAARGGGKIDVSVLFRLMGDAERREDPEVWGNGGGRAGGVSCQDIASEP